jgi:hypothetical protein
VERWGNIDKPAGTAIFLASNASGFVNGHILPVDGPITSNLEGFAVQPPQGGCHARQLR